MSEPTNHPEDPPPSYESVIQNSNPETPHVPGAEPKPPYTGYSIPQQPYPAPPGSTQANPTQQPYPTQPYPTQQQPYPTQPGQYPPGSYPQTRYAYPSPVQGQQPQYNYPPSGQVGTTPGVFTTNTSLGANAQNNLRKKRALLCTTVMIAIFIVIIIFIIQIGF
ncbi:calcium-binding protein P-like [Argopecten irradians]|uniref:calcium-binding protein P-like n=1 Tax=Argopecten irradians TaxID=31199 RepID=UPI00371DFFE2